MSFFILCLILLASLLHATWNFAARSERGKLASFAAGLLFAGALGIVVFLPFSIGKPLSFFWIIASTISHVFYFLYLSKSYKDGDISLVYPITRGVSVSLAVLAGVFLLGESLSLFAVIGIILILVGILTVGEVKRISKAHWHTIKLPLVTGLMSGIYSICDKFGVESSYPPLYVSIIWFGSGLLLLPFVKKEIISQFSWKPTLLIGVGSLSAYLIILYAFRSGNLSYISPAREVSVVLGTALGVIFLREKVSIWRILGIALIISGTVMLGMG